MVAARKTPAAPAPHSSRSTSSQVVPRAQKTKAKATPVNGNSTSSTKPPALSNGKATPKPVLAKRKPKPTGTSFSRRLFLFLISIFSVYALTVCRNDFPRSSPVCKSLDLYRSHILDPYILPPLHTLVEHTKPHLAPLEPYVATVKPYASSTIQFTRTQIVPRVSVAASFAAAQYTSHIHPRVRWFFIDQYWNGIIKPIYFKGPHPFLEAQSRPYRLYYHRFLVPFAQKSAVQAQITYIRVRPHAIAYSKIARSQACNAYKAVKPRVLSVYARVRPHAVVVLDRVKVQAVLAAGKAGDARRQFVDPHIRRIWEKVAETTLASSSPGLETIVATPTPEATQASAEEPTVDAASSSALTETVESTPAATSAIASVVEPEPEPTPEETPASTPTASSASTPVTSSQEASTPSPAVEETQQGHQAAIPPPSAPVAESPIPVEETAAESAAFIVAASLHASAADVPEPNPSAVSEPEPQLDDVDDFLKDIGLDDSADQVPPIDATAPDAADAPQAEAPVYGDAEPSQEERLALTAQKRADITGRHVRWQSDLNALVEAQATALRDILTQLRSESISELKNWGPESKSGKPQGVLGDVEEEATRLVRGVEGYLKGVEEKAKKAGGKLEGEGQASERKKWDKVIEKVEERFAEKVRNVQKEVHDWFVGKKEKEVEQVNVAAATVKSFAERAQADIGLDYAWLDDVTYHDWQKYHDLMRTSENFTTRASTLQAAVDPKGTDILIDALNDLEEEVNDVVDGFNVLLNGVRRRAEGPGGVFTPYFDSEFHKDKESREQHEEKKGEEKEKEDEQVSILPIEPQPTGEAEPKIGGAIGVEDILLGRSKEEVEAKLAGVPVESEARARREEL
ncbi:hypothetical protein DXG03_005245 [Asterophora parasitica]|uniref:Uncharacterized protein n=1 Tax=Asterophora parasitica TaxID=117018 RepID=A0A9P7K9T5_9AGAR|nr:hypothetical protein DXG03_005245 [Asterophora parasitica]